jgi:hypothetical protein
VRSINLNTCLPTFTDVKKKKVFHNEWITESKYLAKRKSICTYMSVIVEK